jgi:FkbM family methyltransferase
MSMKLLSKLNHTVRTTPWLGRLALRAIPDLLWHVSVEPVGKMEIRLRRHRGYWLRSPLSNDAFMMGALTRLLSPGDIVYDIGANIGLYSRFLIQRFHASKVYAFEPMSQNRPQLARNLQLGGCAGQVVVLPFAVADEDGTTTFQVDDVTSFSGTLNAVTGGAASPSRKQYNLPPITECVQVVQLDTVILDRGLMLPDVIKMDIEGAEAMALRGARKLLREQKPALVIELHGASVAIEVLQILWDCNYYCFGYLETKDGLVYKEITTSDLGAITGKYSLHFLAASFWDEKLKLPIEKPEWV